MATSGWEEVAGGAGVAASGWLMDARAGVAAGGGGGSEGGTSYYINSSCLCSWASILHRSLKSTYDITTVFICDTKFKYYLQPVE